MLEFLADFPLLQLFGITMGIQWVAWAFAAYLHTEKFYDLTGAATFILVSHISHSQSIMSKRQSILCWMVFAWACRLGTFLFFRVLKDGCDKRFDKARDDPSLFFKYWNINGLWVFITLLPTLVLNMERRDPPIGIRDYIGWGIWAAGLLFEVVADAQKSYFRANPANKGTFIQSGLWSLSRHPNYFGEISLWFGLYVSASSAFRGSQYLTVLSPVLVMLLITKVSGIPLLEASAQRKWGDLAEYKHYVENTPILVPFLKT